MTFEEGIVLFKSGDYRAAVEQFLAVTELDKNHHKAWNALGICLSKTGQHEDAAECFENALTLSPNNEIYLKNKTRNESKILNESKLLEIFSCFDRQKVFFLSKFYKPRTIDDFISGDLWYKFLNQNPKETIKSLYNEGFLKKTPYYDYIFVSTTIAKLKPICKDRNLRVSGTKSQLIDRIIEFDSNNLKEIFGENRYIQCTGKGQKLVELYREEERVRKEKAINAIWNFLKINQYLEAVRASHNYFSNSLDPYHELKDGISIKSLETEHVDFLKTVETSNPKYLQKFKITDLSQYREITQFSHLFGWKNEYLQLLEDKPGGLQQSYNPLISKALYTHAMFIRDLSNFKENGIKKIEYLAAGSLSCPECQKIDGKVVSINHPIELPFEHCTCEQGCRCCITAHFSKKELGLE